MSSLSDAKYHAQRTATPRPNAKTIPDGILFGRTSFLALTARRHNGRTCSRRLIASAQRCCLYDILRTLNRCFEPQGGELMSAEHKKEYADCANCFFEVKPAECADKWHNEGNALNVRVPKVSCPRSARTSGIMREMPLMCECRRCPPASVGALSGDTGAGETRRKGDNSFYVARGIYLF